MSERAAPRRLPGARKTAGQIRDVTKPVYDSLIREPFRRGRLRIDVTSRNERQLAILGLVVLFGSLVSLVFGNLWREGTLLSLSDSEGRWLFVPQALFAVTLLSLFVGWLLFLWGALRASLPIRLGAALLFLLVNADIGKPSALEVGGSLALRWGPSLARAGYFAAAGVLILYSVLLVGERWRRRLRPVMLALLVASLASLFGGVLWIGATASQHGLISSSMLTLNGTIDTVTNMLLPMVLLAAMALVDFSYSVTESFTAPLWEWRSAVVRALLYALLGLKLWIQLGRNLGQWASLIRQTPYALVTTALALAFFGSMAVLGRMLHRRKASEEQVEDVKEQLMYAGVLAESTVLLVVFALLASATFAFTQTSSVGAFHFIGHVASFTDRWSTWFRLIPWAVLLVAGVYLLTVKRRRELYREAGLGLVLIGGWNVPFYFIGALGLRTFYLDALLEVAITVVIAGVVVADLVLLGLRRAGVRWARPFLNQAATIALLALTLFVWLLFTQGDFVATVATLLLHPVTLVAGSVVVAFGVIYSLLVDSELASSSSRHFPADSRVLLYIGYLILSVVILTWVQVTHASDLASVVQHNGFTDIGIPLAAWLFIRRPWTPAEAEAAALPSEVGMVEAAEIAEEQGDEVEAGWTWTEAPAPEAWGDPDRWEGPDGPHRP